MSGRIASAVCAALLLCAAHVQARAQAATDDPALSAAVPATPPATVAEPAPTEALADSLSARGRYLAAIRVYEVLPRTAVISNKLGIACENMLMFDKAKLNFEQAIKEDPKYAEAYNNLGTISHSQGDLRRAEKMYLKSTKLKPGTANTWKNLGTLYYAQRRFKKGNEAYQRAVALDPHVLDRTTHGGIQAMTKGKGMGEVHYQLAITCAKTGNAKASIEYLRLAITEGFHDKTRLLHEKDFGELRTAPEFLALADDMKKE